MFTKILIANRGEVSCRIAASARRMGISTVAVYSDADELSAHTAACDEAIRIGTAPVGESYLQRNALIAAALQTKAQAIHPSYEFLSENEAFAQDCLNAGLTFIGSPVNAILAMGSKLSAKRLMQAAGVPLVPGYHEQDQCPDTLQKAADEIGYPILIKPSAGGGGKGMHVVNHASNFKTALATCQREAQSAFGDAQVLIEKYIDQPRHVEIQIFSDMHGQCVHLFERDCSVQRCTKKYYKKHQLPT